MRHLSAAGFSGMTYLRVAALVIFSVVFVRMVPYVAEQTGVFQFFSNQVVNMGILYAIIVGFLMSIALKRRQSLDESVSQELNKIRRIYHLSKHLAVHNPTLSAWFKDVRQALTGYNDLFCEHDFGFYELGNALFRKVTYAIYRLPKECVSYNEALYMSLLTAAADATESRETIRSKLTQTIGGFQWSVIAVITGTLSAILVASTPDDSMSRVVTTAVVFNLFLVLLLIYEYDAPSRKNRLTYASYYAHNLADIDPCPPKRPKAAKRVARNVTRVARRA